jgi:hypothetical protein
LLRWEILYFVKIMLIMKNITGFINWKSCSPEILSISLSFFKPKRSLQISPDNNQKYNKLYRKVHFFLNHPKIVIDFRMRK